ARKGVNKSVRLGNGGARSVAHEEHDCDQHQRKTNEETGNRIRSFHLDSPGSGHGKPRDLSVAQVPSRGKGGWPHGDRKMRDETPPVYASGGQKQCKTRARRSEVEKVRGVGGERTR